MSSELNESSGEVIHLYIGSGSTRIGNEVWKSYSLEHQFDSDGMIHNDELPSPPQCFFEERNHQNKKSYRPRAIFLDEGLVLDRIRQEIEKCDHFQGFIFTHSTCGKSSNVSSNLLIDLKTNYSKNTLLTNPIIGSSMDSSLMSNLLNYADVIIPMENESIYRICQNQLNISDPQDFILNRLIAICSSNLTCSMRFDGCCLSKLEEFSSMLIPYPKLKFISSTLSPLIPFSSNRTQEIGSPSVYDMCIPSLFQSTNCFVRERNGLKKVLSLCLLFRGEKIIPKEIGQKLICDMKKLVRFSDQTPTGFHCGINYHRPYIFNEQSDLLLTDKQVLMLTNNVTTSIDLLQSSLNQNSSEEVKDNLEEVKNQYEQFEKEIE